jgi:hypothetical protein
LFNMDWTGHGTWQANTAAALMIAGSALFIEGAMRLRSWVLSPICIIAALFLVYVNTKQATRVLSFSSEAASEAREAEIAGGSHVASERSHLLARRQAQAEIAGETTVGALVAQLRALQLSDLRAWNATSGCEDVTAKASAAFCTKVAAARAKLEAAKARERIDAELAKLPVPKKVMAASSEVPVVDAYVANVVALLREAGFKPSERLVKAEEAMARALGFELLAALGPTCWLGFVNMMMGAAHVTAAAARMRRPGTKREEPDPPAALVSATPVNADDYDRAIADLFNEAPAGVMRAKDIRPLVRSWFDSKGKALEESRLWAKMGEKFRRDPNNGRPRYMGLKPRLRGPPNLAVVAGGTSG